MTRHPRIAVFSYGLPVVGQKRGGIERAAHELADGLARRGYPVTVWSYDPKPQEAAYDVQTLPGKQFASARLGLRLTMGYLGNLLPLALNGRTYDLLIAHGDSLLAPLLNKPVIRFMHGSALGEALSAQTPWRFLSQLGVYVQELLTGLTQKYCVAGSENTRRYNPFIRRVIPYGIDTDVFRSGPRAKADHPAVLFVGSLDGRKRGALLLDWFARFIRPLYPDASLDMVSPPGPSVPGVTYHMGVTNEALIGLYQRAWVYASPSTYEGFGLPYLEAMACGTPVLATPNPGSREVLDGGRYGVLADDPVFPEELKQLLADRAARGRWAELGLRRAQMYSLDKALDACESLLKEVGSARRRRNGD